MLPFSPLLRLPSLARRAAAAAPLALLGGCFGAAPSDPCVEYCDYICDCHPNDPEYDCDACRTSLGESDPALQDACETELVALQEADQQASDGCFADEEGFDTGR
jgi:hypothetical protein